MHALQKIGLIAGNGSLPVHLLKRWKSLGVPYVLMGLEGITPPTTLDLAGEGMVFTHSIGQAGKILKTLKDQGVTDIVMVGGMTRPNFWTLRVDWVGLSIVLKALIRSVGDDRLLKLIRDVFACHGLTVRGAHEFLPEYLAGEGVMGAVPVPVEDEARIAVALEAVHRLGAEDKGQAVIIGRDGTLFYEDKSGTNALMDKGRDLESPILVKMAKPQQDLALDMPTIGIETIERAHRNRFVGLVVNADKTLMVEKEVCIAACNRYGLFLVGKK